MSRLKLTLLLAAVVAATTGGYFVHPWRTSPPVASAAPSDTLPRGYEAVTFGTIPEGAKRVDPERVALFERPDSAPRISHTMVFDTIRLRALWSELDPDAEVPSFDFDENAVLVVYFPRGESPSSPEAYAREQGTHVVLELGRYAHRQTPEVSAAVYLVPTERGAVSTVDMRPGPLPSLPTSALAPTTRPNGS